ncbi:MAG: DUF4199 domain-containing protein [Pseudomonadota bacterium]
MKRTMLVYGVISGLIIIIINTASYELGHGHVWLGFLVMFIAFSAIFVGVKQYRDEALGGVITFSSALMVGLGITVVASLIYVAVWEVYLSMTQYEFIDSYSSAMVEAKRQAGATATEILALEQEMAEFAVQYQNPLVRLPMTFIEIFPAGVLVSLVSALVLRTHKST